MKKYLFRASGIAAMAILMSTSVFSQEERERTIRDDRDRATSNSNSNRNKLGEGDEITIIKKGNKDGRVVVEVRDGEVTVNGRPIEEYKEGDVIIRRNRSTFNNSRVYTPSSPFRSQGQGGATVFEGVKDRAYLGVVTEKSDDGARISSVTDNSAADKAGLREGDVITHIGDTRVHDHDDLSTTIRKHKPEDRVNITVLRDGRERRLDATLGKIPGATTFTAPKIKGNGHTFDMGDMGERFQLDLNNDFNRVFSYGGRARLGIRAQDTEDGRGVKVVGVDDGSAADKAGIREGDVITEFEGNEVNSADELAKAAKSVKDDAMSIRLQRDGRSQTVEVRIPKKLKTTNL